jgi:HSP20 family molecular chaperone IbpA
MKPGESTPSSAAATSATELTTLGRRRSAQSLMLSSQKSCIYHRRYLERPRLAWNPSGASPPCHRSWKEWPAMLMRKAPFRELDRLTQQVFGNAGGTWSRPIAMPMDAYRPGDQFVVSFDLPGVSPEAIEPDVERNVLTAKAQRRPATPRENVEMQVADRPLGVFSRATVPGRHPRHRPHRCPLRRRRADPADPDRREGEAPARSPSPTPTADARRSTPDTSTGGRPGRAHADSSPRRRGPTRSSTRGAVPQGYARRSRSRCHDSGDRPGA